MRNTFALAALATLSAAVKIDDGEMEEHAHFEPLDSRPQWLVDMDGFWGEFSPASAFTMFDANGDGVVKFEEFEAVVSQFTDVEGECKWQTKHFKKMSQDTECTTIGMWKSYKMQKDIAEFTEEFGGPTTRDDFVTIMTAKGWKSNERAVETFNNWRDQNGDGIYDEVDAAWWSYEWAMNQWQNFQSNESIWCGCLTQEGLNMNWSCANTEAYWA